MITLLAFVFGMCLQSSALTVNNTGYEDLVVAIHKDVPQDNKIIEELKGMFRDASLYLYEALDRRAYFRSVIILVPETWTADPTWGDDDSLTFKDANIRVDRPHPLHGTDPYVFQPGQCGEEGRYIHFTPDFVLNRDSFRDFNYGNAGRVLVHEFAHYRYGVFDEKGFQGSKHHPLWYLEGREAKPTGCSRNVAGLTVENDILGCYSQTSNGLPTDDCIFIPFMTNTIRASLMAYHYVRNVTRFCKTYADNAEEQHNFLAPNQHNKMCDKTGTYEVIMSHADFRLGSPPVDGIDVTPTFTVVQRRRSTTDGGQEKCGRRTVLVLDLSGSMTSNEKYFKLGQAGDRLIRDILPVGTDLGIVTFSSSAKVWTPMTLITDDTARNATASKLPNRRNFGGGTRIAKGLSAALELLRQGGKETKDANIVLITDGISSENLLQLSLPSLIEAKVKVHSIGLGPDAEGTLGQLSEETGGSFSYYSEASTSTDLDSAMERLLEFIATCENVGGIEIERLGFLLNQADSPFTGIIYVDDSVGNNTIFSFAFPRGVSMTVTITDPNNKEYDSSSTEYSYTSALNIVRFRFIFAVDGIWRYSIQTESRSSQLVILVVKSNVRDSGKPPIEAETRLNTAELNLSDQSAALVVYTYVHRGYEPLIRAKVTVTVDRSPDPVATISLKDDGILPDNREDDGVYTAYFTAFTGTQRISMQTRVESVPGQTAFVVAGGSGSSSATSIYQNTTAKPVYQPAGNFTRTSSPGAADVKGFVSGVDLFPPGAISDLQIVTFDKVLSTVTLTWTSPGDDYTEGTVNRYELRVAGDFDSLMFNFNTSNLITVAKVGNFTPVEAGSPHTVVVEVPSEWPNDSYIFGLKAFDEVNKSSALSNLPSVTFQTIILPGPPPVPTGEPKKIPYVPIIAGVVGGAIVLLIIIVIIVVLCRNRNPKRVEEKQPESTDPKMHEAFRM